MFIILQPVFAYTGVVTKASAAAESDPGAGLAVIEHFLNTLDERSFSRLGTQHTGGEELSTPAALAAWLSAHGMVPPGTRVSPADLGMAHDVRRALRDALLLRAGAPAGQVGLARGNAKLGGIPLRVEFGMDGNPRLSAAGGVAGAGGTGNAAGALAAIVAAVAMAQASGTWKRLKMCAAEDCRWVFYDGSRSGAGRWCSMSVCGNRDKTRAYRQRAARR